PVAPPKAHSRSIVSRAGRRVRPLRVSGLKGSDQAGSSSTAGIGLSAEAGAPAVGSVLGDDAQYVANQVELTLAQIAQAAHLVDKRPERGLLIDIQLPRHGRYQGLDLLCAEPGFNLAQGAGDQGRQVALHAS